MPISIIIITTVIERREKNANPPPPDRSVLSFWKTGGKSTVIFFLFQYIFYDTAGRGRRRKKETNNNKRTSRSGRPNKRAASLFKDACKSRGVIIERRVVGPGPPAAYAKNSPRETRPRRFPDANSHPRTVPTPRTTVVIIIRHNTITDVNYSL